MSAVATLGDLLRTADWHLEAAEVAGTPWDSGQAAGEVGRIIRVLASYLDDLAKRGVIADFAWASDWERAGIQLREALQSAGSSMQAESGYRLSEPSEDDLRVRHLADAADALSAGLDLTHSHHVSDTDGQQADWSTWADVIPTPPFTRALVDDIGRRLPLLISWTKRLEQDHASTGLLDNFTGATGSLRMAMSVVTTARAAEPVGQYDRELLYGIPAATMPPRLPPAAAEEIPELCDGVLASAARLRRITFHTPAQAASAPGMSGRAWERSAKAAAIYLHTAELVMRALTDGFGQDGPRPMPGWRAQGAVSTLAAAREAWIRSASAWGDFTTETRSVSNPAVVEMGDLVIRMGRLAFDNPQWAPERAQRARLRGPLEIAGNHAEARAVLSAVHEGVDAVARLAAADVSASWSPTVPGGSTCLPGCWRSGGTCRAPMAGHLNDGSSS
jgi:hypothetical protein